MAGDLSRERFRRLLLALSPEEFEYFVADLWDRVRPGTVRVTQASGDMGVDVVVDGEEREIIQAKRYGPDNPVGRPEIQQYYALYDQENADRVTVVTSGRVAETAEAWAVEHGVTLFDGDDLYDLIRAADCSELLSEWFVTGEYSLDGPGLTGRVGRLLRPVVSVPGALIRLGRPLWASLLAFVAGTLLLAGVVAFLTPPGGPASLEGSRAADTLEAALTGALLVSFVMFPLSLALYGLRRRALLVVGVCVGSLVAINADGDLAYNLGLVALDLSLLAIAVYDIYAVSRGGLWTHVRASLGPLAGLFGTGSDGDGVDPMRYATVAARRDAD